MCVSEDHLDLLQSLVEAWPCSPLIPPWPCDGGWPAGLAALRLAPVLGESSVGGHFPVPHIWEGTSGYWEGLLGG